MNSRKSVYAAAACGLLVLAAVAAGFFLHRSRSGTTPGLGAGAAAAGAKAAVMVADDSAAARLEKIVPQYVWLFHNNELRFLPGGTAAHPGFTGGFHWSVDRTAHNAPTVRLEEVDEAPNRALRSVLWFYPDLSGFTNYEHIDKWEGPGAGGVRLGLRLPLPNEVAAVTTEANPLAGQIRESVAKARDVYDALVDHAWTWTDLGNASPASVVRFQPDGHVSGGWTWELVDRLDGTFLVDCSWGNNGHQYLVFDPSLESFDSYDSAWTCVVKGQRVKGADPVPAVAVAPAPAPVPPALPAVTPAPAPVSPAARRAAQVYDAIVGYNWAWMNEGDSKPPLVVAFNRDGHVSGGWTWQPVYKLDGDTVVDCVWGDNGHEYLRLNEACDAFEAFDSQGNLKVKGKRLSPIGQPVNLDGLVASLKAAPVSPATRRAAQVYDAIVGYNWGWMNEGDSKPPLVVTFNWDGHVSGGWTWQPVYKPDGDTVVDCVWGDNGHEYLRLNEACDAFEAFDSQGNFKVKGKRLSPIGQPVNLGGLAAPLAATDASKASAPSKQIEPLLEPCLNAILAPLEANPQMPRVPVEKLRASLGGGAVKAKTPLQKQIYQYGMAVCEALTNGMDERALTKAAALSSSWVPSLSNGGSIVNTMPLRGWDAGHAGDAIRKKQKDERRYADQRAGQYSVFMESSAYKAWVSKSAMLRENVMNLYTRLVQLEAAEAAASTPSPSK